MEAGNIIKVEVIQKNEDNLLLKVDENVEAIMKKDQIKEGVDINDINVGDVLEAQILKFTEGEILLTQLYEANEEVKENEVEEVERKEAPKESAPGINFDEIKNELETKKEIKVVVKNVVKGGVTTTYKGLRAFIPASLLSDNFIKDLNEYKDKEIDVIIKEIDEKKKSVVLSAKDILIKKKNEEIDNYLNSISVGDEIKCKVKSTTDFGAFVDMGKVDGLIHISELSFNKDKAPKDVVEVGEEVEVVVTKINKEKKKVSLKLKELKDDPWKDIDNLHKRGDELKGVVTSIMDFGAFVKLESNIEGLVHISQISNERVEKIEDVLKVGQEVDVRIISIDKDKKKISLSMKPKKEYKPKEKEEEFVYEPQRIETTIGSLFKDKFKDLKFDE